MKRTASGDYVVSLLARYPDAPTMTLAKIALRERPKLWKDAENCRCLIRYYRGNHGKESRGRLTNKEFIRPNGKSGWSDVIPPALVQLPGWGAEVIKGPHRALILNDIHIPFHDPQALEIALDFAFQEKVTCIILNGDIADHFSLSKFEKDPEIRDFPGEVAAVKFFLEGLRRRAGRACRILYKLGNHEERYEAYMRHKAPELIGVPNFEWEEIFGLKNYDVQMVKDKRPIQMNELNLLHGHEYPFKVSQPVSAARGLFLKAMKTAACGHFHVSTHHPATNVEDKVVSCWSIGCLCDRKPQWLPINGWVHGFAIVELGTTGFNFENHMIIEGKVR